MWELTLALPPLSLLRFVWLNFGLPFSGPCSQDFLVFSSSRAKEVFYATPRICSSVQNKEEPPAHFKKRKICWQIWTNMWSSRKSSHDGTLLWKIPEFAKKRQDAVSGQQTSFNDVWCLETASCRVHLVSIATGAAGASLQVAMDTRRARASTWMVMVLEEGHTSRYSLLSCVVSTMRYSAGHSDRRLRSCCWIRIT